MTTKIYDYGDANGELVSHKDYRQLEAERDMLWEALNKIYISGTPDDEAWQIAMNALRSKDV